MEDLEWQSSSSSEIDGAKPCKQNTRQLSRATSTASVGTMFVPRQPVRALAKSKGCQLRLWYVLLLVFVASVVSMACVMSIFWYNRSTQAVNNFLDGSNATWESTIENITRQLHRQASQLEDSIITNALTQPIRAVELNADLLKAAGPNLGALMNYTFLQLSTRFKAVEGISIAFSTGRAFEYERNSQHPRSSWRHGNYNLEYIPGDDLNTSGCPVMCPPPSANVTRGYTHQFSVDDETGRFGWMLKKYLKDPLQGFTYKRAVEARGQTIWTRPFVQESDHQLELRAAKAVIEDGQVFAVVGCDIMLGHLSALLSRIVLAKSSRAYIIDRGGYIIASSDGWKDSIGVHTNQSSITQEEGRERIAQLLPWNMIGDPIIERSMHFLIEKYNILERRNEPVAVVDAKRAHIYSAVEFHSEGDTYGLDWIIVNTQPLSTYMEPIEETINDDLHHELIDLHGSIWMASMVTLIFVLIGTIMMAVVARAVTQPLRAIEIDMRAVANFEHDAIERILSDNARYGSRTIAEVSDMCNSFQHMANGLQSFSRYVDPHLAQTLVKTKREAVLGMVKADVTVFFSDIAGFTTMAENLDPEVLMDVLGEYLQAMSSIVMEHGGVVGEFVGDEIMAWWNAPPLEFDGKQHTVAALSAALEQQQRLAELREHWSEQGLPGFTVRMGLVRGQALAGNLGSTTRMKYGLVGDNVNLASRLEGLCKMYGVGCLVDDGVRLAPGVPEHFVFRSVDLVSVKGRKNATEIFELVAKRGTDALAAPSSLAFSADFAAVQEQYRQGDFTGALVALESFESRWPGDKPASILRDRCEKLLKYPPGNDWSPMVQLHEK